jgi:hypothetical protein
VAGQRSALTVRDDQSPNFDQPSSMRHPARIPAFVLIGLAALRPANDSGPIGRFQFNIEHA